MAKKMTLEEKLKEIINKGYKEKINPNQFPEDKKLSLLLNQWIDDYNKIKNENVSMKTILMDDVDNITNILEKVSLGDFEQKIPTLKLAELSNLSLGIEDMIRGLKKSKNELDELYKTQDELKQKDLAVKVKKMLDWVSKVETGDLTEEMKAEGEGDINQLAVGLNDMVCSLKMIINNMKDVIMKIGSATTEISSTNTELKNNAELQLERVSEVSSTVTQFTGTFQQTAGFTKKVAENAEISKLSLNEGFHQIQEIVKKSKALQEMIQQTVVKLMELKSNAGQINEIIEMIAKIADKSDLLALNAAIEAGGAGASGQRFRVVADEMRRLADSTMQSSMKISDIIKRLQFSVENNVSSINDMSSNINEISKIIDNTGVVLERGVKVFDDTTVMMKQVSLATSEQMKGAENINNATNQITIAAKQNLVGIEQVIKAVNNFLELSQSLNDMIAVYKLQ